MRAIEGVSFLRIPAGRLGPNEATRSGQPERLVAARATQATVNPANMDISDAAFEQMLNQARESLIRGLLPTS